ncbi:MAG: hypothetical protein KIT84_22480 [Labilithrix sp.]|nr:hypothetical protein [Labilithrix sp.]MCW5813811.1 hypothetical protein [Labilithrix sp.]
MRSLTKSLPLLPLLVCVVGACGDDDPVATGKGTVKFTTWGEEYIEDEIPVAPGPDDESGFTDGWQLKYTKFLVNVSAITVADASGNVVAKLDKPRFFDNVKPGKKDLIEFPNIDAKAYPQVSYEITPAVADAQIVGGADPADLTMMVTNGWSVYAAGTATKGDVTKTFKWGLKAQTRYENCNVEEDGIDKIGIVVTNGQTDVSELTTHGDHFFYDQLQSGDNAKKTLLRFQEKADADANDDGEITIQELCAKNIDPAVYNTSGLPGATIGDFVISLVRTVGHFRGEGECTVKRIDPVPAGVVNPCDEYK